MVPARTRVRATVCTLSEFSVFVSLSVDYGERDSEEDNIIEDVCLHGDVLVLWCGCERVLFRLV